MASATGIPERQPNELNRAAETQPLLGEPGDVTQRPHESIFKNLISGTAWLAQVGALLLLILVWAAVLSHPPLIPLFSPHPLLQSLGILLVIQAILILQPTHAESPTSKATGARLHATLNALSFTVLLAGVAIIEANKFSQGPGSHFHSVHGYLGVITSIVLLLQYIVGLLMWVAPGWLGRHVLRFGSGGSGGSEEEEEEDAEQRGKALWKYHRASGYGVVLVLLLATVVTAPDTAFNVNVLGIPTWAVAVAVALVVVGVYPRLKASKLGLRRAEQGQ
ncbi:hypothetical protein BD289DRAFT_483436 [Coniella lustricola]|uniref:Cytochrome b561 domain-containing protein n=1 Tax=Coniella lustricola TaxID=2025994 RepID=A0A2T3A5I0_9PEZI|nr:hypothetical protein BD289DRAFT_483436 [Coniella lustricola]